MTEIIFLWVFLGIIFVCILFAHQARYREQFVAITTDIESRLEWAQSRLEKPNRMEAQLVAAEEDLRRAKKLWSSYQWAKACAAAKQAESAMNRAQKLYCALVRRRKSQHEETKVVTLQLSLQAAVEIKKLIDTQLEELQRQPIGRHRR